LNIREPVGVTVALLLGLDDCNGRRVVVLTGGVFAPGVGWRRIPLGSALGSFAVSSWYVCGDDHGRSPFDSPRRRSRLGLRVSLRDS
jgi:hypothetical protein